MTVGNSFTDLFHVMGDLGFCIESVGIIYISRGVSVLVILKEKLKFKVLQDNLDIFVQFQAELDLLIFLGPFQPELFYDWWCWFPAFCSC